MNNAMTAAPAALTSQQALDAATTIVSAHPEAAMRSSALVCLDEAAHLLAKGEDLFAGRRALKAIAYTVGIFHAEYARVCYGLGMHKEIVMPRRV